MADRVVWDPRTRTWARGGVLGGGAPWGLLRVAPAARGFVARVRGAGSEGVVPAPGQEAALARRLVARGMLSARPEPATDCDDVVIIVPAYGRPEALARCLASIAPARAIVVDDGTAVEASIAQVALDHGARLLRHETNRGPAAARNTGLRHTTARVVAFLDSDCTAHPGWVQQLLGHLAEEDVAMVAPRVRARGGQDPRAGGGLLARYEAARSALDMGPHPEQVRHGARLSFLPTAALVVRRDALPPDGFDETLRLGEDVDLVWRTLEAGWQVRYDPSVVVEHDVRAHPLRWASRRRAYGTSAAALDRRHPGRVAPARVSIWNLGVLAAVAARRPRTAAGIAATAATRLASALHTTGVPPALAARIVPMGLVADAAALGHALRREWWPLGWVVLATAARRRPARLAAAAMTLPILLEHARSTRTVPLPAYIVLRLIDDAAYGTGVLSSALRDRRVAVLRPQIRRPGVRGAGGRAPDHLAG